jgi:hypothetical protein
VYEEVLKKNPKDEDFMRHWFQQMIFRSNLDGARKAIYVWKTYLTTGRNSIEQAA